MKFKVPVYTCFINVWQYPWTELLINSCSDN